MDNCDSGYVTIRMTNDLVNGYELYIVTIKYAKKNVFM
jgi:hypothetical protein